MALRGSVSSSIAETGSFGALTVGGAYVNNTGITVHGTSRLNGSLDLFGTGDTSQINMGGSDTTKDGIIFSTTNTIGFLDAGGSNAIQHINDNGTYFFPKWWYRNT